MGPYRSSDIVNAPPPSTLVALLWRWILLRRADRVEREERATVIALEAPRKRVTIHMRRGSVMDPFKPHREEVSACPGKSAPRPENIDTARDYFLCTAEHCCCEVR